MWNGIRDFSSEFGVDDIGSLDELPDLSEGTVLISIPYLEFSNDDLENIKQFVDSGGTLLLFDDYGYGNSVLVYFDASVRFSSEPLLDPLFSYKNQWMPKATDFSSDLAESNINVVVLNHATALSNTVAEDTIAWSSGTSFLDTNGNGTLDKDELNGPLPLAAQFRLGEGTVVVVSDPSIMINSMVERDDNYAFIQYLISLNGEPENILIDYSHLTQAPLDISKMRIRSGREMLSSPYAMVGVIFLVFIVVSRITLGKGDIYD